MKQGNNTAEALFFLYYIFLLKISIALKYTKDGRKKKVLNSARRLPLHPAFCTPGVNS